jgi:hypothetical protein
MRRQRRSVAANCPAGKRRRAVGYGRLFRGAARLAAEQRLGLGQETARLLLVGSLRLARDLA